MPLADVRLSILAFPQRWSGAALETRVLLLPTGDPTQAPPAAVGLPMFAGTSWTMRAMVLPGLDALLGPNPSATSGAVTFGFMAPAPANALALFQAIGAQFPIVVPDADNVRLTRLGATSIRKHLPASYTDAFPFERPGPGTSVGDEFGCALRDVVAAKANDPKPPPKVTWGAVLSFALRQPLLARALGLLHDVTIPLAASPTLDAGGWLYVELDPAGPVQPLVADAVRRYAARLPVLADNAKRPVFGAVLFPVGLTGAGSYDAALAEAAVYDDGFAKIMHAAQAVTADAASSGHNRLKPATDAGMDLGWDDEQVTIWLNRQVEGLRARLDPTVKAVEAPLGVSGYRVDVRLADDPNGGWESLCQAFSVDANGARAPLQFPPPPANAVFTADFQDELAVEPTPVRALHAPDGFAWLPQHYARWQGGSLVANDTTLFELAGTTPRNADGDPMAVPPSTYGAPIPAVRLRYGNRYEFRCRLADLTGGGPTPLDDPSNPAPRPSATARFLRHVPPKSVRLQTDIPRPAPGEPTPTVSTVSTIDVWRPLIGYPELVFAGIDDPAVVAQLLANAPAARAALDGVGVNDPDVALLQISVQVRAPAHDPGPEGLRDGDFRELYATAVDFPPFDAGDVFGPGAPITLTLDYVDQADIATLAKPIMGDTTLPVPRARDVRLRLTPVCGDKPDYFGSAAVQRGLTVDVQTRAPAESETGIFMPRPDELALSGILLRPAPDMMDRLADHLDLVANGLTLAARPGERVVFAASAALRHALSGDRGSLTFAADGELLGHWLAAIQLQLNRDWTWDGLEDLGIVVSRRDLPADALRVVGAVQMPFTVPALAIVGTDLPGEDRRAWTRLVFLDAVDPHAPAGAFPTTPTPEWVLEPRIRELPLEGPALARTIGIRLPVAVPPRQVPKLIAAGIALSPYQRDAAYASTEPRRRVLWFEFAEPVADPNDLLFARVTAYGPDPLLSGALTHLLVPVPDVPIGPIKWFDLIESLLPTPPEPPPLAIEPELIRVIVPHQPEDDSGRDKMDPMEAGTPPAGEVASRHFIVPLPRAVDPDAAEFFGFWTYEIRIGHDKIWSTSQARYGRPLIAKGVQHPPPALRCSAFRTPGVKTVPPRIVAIAPHATAVFKDDRLTRPAAGDPRTRIWILLYAQVTQADGGSKRNVLLARALAAPRVDRDVTGLPVPPKTHDVMGVAQFFVPAVEQVLTDLALPADAPLSVLAVEMLPGDHLIQQSRHLPDLQGAIPGQQVYFTVDQPDGPPYSDQDLSALAGFRSNVTSGSDPLGAELGSMASRRILRCSPLTPVAPAC